MGYKDVEVEINEVKENSKYKGRVIAKSLGKPLNFTCSFREDPDEFERQIGEGNLSELVRRYDKNKTITYGLTDDEEKQIPEEELGNHQISQMILLSYGFLTDQIYKEGRRNGEAHRLHFPCDREA